jgi:hypothetical protein
MAQHLNLGINEEAIARSRSKTRRLGELLAEIENLLSSGVPRQAVLEALNQQGFDLSMPSFATMLKRLRKRSANSQPPTGRSERITAGRSDDAKRHARQVHEQFKANPDRPRTVQHDLTSLPDW